MVTPLLNWWANLLRLVHITTPYTPYQRWLLPLLGDCYHIPRMHDIDKASGHIRGDYVSHTNLIGGRLTPDNHTSTGQALGSKRKWKQPLRKRLSTRN